MNATEVLKLIDAGFTKDEILKMTSEAIPTKEVEEKEVIEETTPIIHEEETAKEEPNRYRAELDAKMSELTNAISDFTRRVQEANVLTARMSDEMIPKEQTPEDIIAKIINPRTGKDV